jgi:hypothetical protein
MLEFEIYLPTTYNDGSPVNGAKIQQIKDRLGEVFGGYTHLRQRSEGAWRMGSVIFYDEVTIVRVIDDGSNNFDWLSFKRSIENALRQDAVLIIAREVKVV